MDCTIGSFDQSGWSLDNPSDGRTSPLDDRTPHRGEHRNDSARPESREGQTTGGLGGTTTPGSQATPSDDPWNIEQYRRAWSKFQKGSLDIEEPYHFVFKHRQTSGRPIHVAALHRDGAKLMSLLLENGARVDDPCTAVDERDSEKKRTYTLQPIHLAAGHGNVNTLRVLLAAGADVQARTLISGEDHYAPLHEAAYFSQSAAVRLLIENDANPNSLNSLGQTPLHIAAAVGCWRVAQHLVSAGTDLRVEDGEGNTALMTAIAGCYPDRKLHVLARECMTDLMEVAKEAPSAAEELLKDTEAWRKGLMDASQGYRLPTVKDLVSLLAIAPKVAGLLLDVLTVMPPVEDPFHHPLPRHARHDLFDFRLCEYTPDTVWKHYPNRAADTGVGDQFRHLMSQKEAKVDKKDNLDEVMEDLGYSMRPGRLHIRMLKMPNIVCFDLLNALARLNTKQELEVFQRPAVQAVLDFTWFHIVRLEYTVNLIIKVLELTFLVWVTFAPPSSEDGRRISWSMLTVTGTRSAFAELMQLKGYHTHLKSVKTYFENTWNYVDIGTIVLFMVLTWGAVWSLVFDSRELLAFASFFRWIQLLYNTGAYRFLDLGYKIVPIFQSFFQVSGIATITLFTFLAFFHAFAALENAGEIGPMEVFINAFRLLLVGDGDGIQYVLNLGGRGDNGDIWTQLFFYFGVLIFCVCILNLFIAVHGGAYDEEYARVTENFYRNRACICLSTMLQPRWRAGFPMKMKPLLVYVLLMLVALPIWIILLLFVDAHPVVASAVLLVALLLGDAVLRKRPWREKHGHPFNFWAAEDMRETTARRKITPECVESVVPPDRPETAFPFPATGEAFERTQTPARTNTPPIPEAEHWPNSPGRQRPEAPELREKRKSTTPEAPLMGPRDSETTEKSLERSNPSTGRVFGSVKTHTPRLRAEMYLWWVSWAEDAVTEAERRAEAEGALSESFGRLDAKVVSVARRLNSQDARFSQMEQRLDGFGRNLTKSIDGLAKRLDGRFSNAGCGTPHFGAVEGRLGSLEAQVSELQRSISQLAGQLRPAVDALAAASAPASAAGSPERGASSGARGREALGRRAGVEGSAADLETVRSGDAGGGRPRSVGTGGGASPIRSDGDDAGGIQEGLSPASEKPSKAAIDLRSIIVGSPPRYPVIGEEDCGTPSFCLGNECMRPPEPAMRPPEAARLPLPLEWGA